MTIAERKAREAYDRENPWRPVREMSSELHGHICELRIALYNTFEDMGRQLYHNERVVEFRSSGIVLDEGRRRSVIERSDGEYEYRGGKVFRKPRRYKLFWRADDA